MCDMCAANELKMLSSTLRDYLRPGVRIAVNHAISDNDAEEILLVDDEAKTCVTLSSVGPMCWETENRGNVVEFPGNIVAFPA